MQRRIFLMAIAGASATIGTGARAQAMVDEKDPQAAALGYVAEAKRADVKKFSRYVAGQACNNCTLFQGKPADKSGACALFAGKQVAGEGWCSAWVKKG